MRIIFIFLSLLFFVTESFSQNNDRYKLREEINMAYMPPSPNQKTSPAFRLDSTGFFTVQVNVNLFGENILGDAANEPSIAVDPINPHRIVIGWRQFDNVNSSFRQAGYAYSDDGGKTWINKGVVIDPGNFRSDPVLDFDADGNFYYNSLGVDNNDNMWCDVYRITDGGFEWDDGIYAYGGDKQWMRIDRGESIGKGNIYAEWNQVYSVCNEGSFTRSTDGGDSYEGCSPVTNDPYWGTLAVGPEGELYEVGKDWNYDDGVMIAKSTTAMNPELPVSWDFTSYANLNGYLTGWSDINPQGLVGQAWIDVDKSDGPGKGYVYVLASVKRNDSYDPADVMFTRSTDGGVTWDDPVRVNDDNSTSNYQWMGTMSVAPDGRIDVIWLDTRDAEAGHPHNSALYYSYSMDNGVTFSENVKLTPTFNPHLGYPQQQKMGDYFDMVSDLNGAHLAWANTFNGEEDVYYAHIEPDFITAAKQKKNIVNAGLNFRIYPNPVNKDSRFVYNLKKKSVVSLEVYDLLGKKLLSVVNGEEQAGNRYAAIDFSNLVPGIYVAVLKAGSNSENIKFVVK